MKLLWFLVFALPILCHSYPSEEKSLSLEDSDQVEAENESKIQKRSGSLDFVTHLKTGLLSGLGRASASIASGSSGGSAGGSGKSHDSGHHGNSVDYDPWSLKKSVLNTIFQAVKAITGGVTAIKGQLIKGSGYALSAGGKLVAASGDKVTDVGKAIINSAQIPHTSHGGSYGGGSSHPFAKFSSLSGASSSSGHSGGPGPVVHHETITSYEIPSGHSSYGPPSKPPSYSSATHQYLPPAAAAAYSGGVPFNGHAAFEAPPANYLPSSYGHVSYDGALTAYSGHDDDDFNFDSGLRHKPLTDEEARKAAVALQDILAMLPSPGKTEFTATKTVTADFHTGPSGPGEINADHVELTNYGLPANLGPLESLSHTESITAAYRPQLQQQQQPPHSHQTIVESQNPSDVYWQMGRKQNVNVLSPSSSSSSESSSHGGYKYKNPHTNLLTHTEENLTPIIAALAVTASGKKQPTVNTHYTVQKNVHNFKPLPASVTGYDYGTRKRENNYSYHRGVGGKPQNHHHPPPPPPPPPHVSAHKPHEYTYFNPVEDKIDPRHNRSRHTSSYKVRRQLMHPPNYKSPLSSSYEIEDPALFNRMLMSF